MNKNKLKIHWNNAYTNNEENKLGWYENDVTPTIKLIKETHVNKSARIINIGAGSTTLIDELVVQNYSNLIATDISNIALENLAKRVNSSNIEYIVDDITNPTLLNDIKPIDLWIDRAVLHFFTEEKDQNTYFDLLKSKVNKNGFVLFAEFNLEGASKCSRLPVFQYNKEMLAKKLGADFELVNSFNHTFIMHNGGERPYIYALFKRK
jgi:cyclopropane fatty-acyl-phospholipid synthase-like methyltransferase